MPGIFWIGNPYFSPHLQALGRVVRTHVPSTPAPVTWSDILALNNGPPDVLVLGDNSMPPLLLGVERYPCLTAFFCVDSHIHSWHPAYAQAFDLCCLNLKDNLPAFRQRLQPEQLLWLPLWAEALEDHPPAQVPEVEKLYDLLFVGNVSPDIHPGRYAFFQRLTAAFPGFTVLQGDYHRLFPLARLVFNYAERGDLNFRVFQALGTGACLLTSRTGHGQAELFREGEDLFCYDPEDLNGVLLPVLRRLLDSPELRARVGRNGLAAVNAGHRAPHRAKQFAEWLDSQPAGVLVSRRLEQARGIYRAWLRLLYLHMAEGLPSPLRERYLEQARQG